MASSYKVVYLYRRAGVKNLGWTSTSYVAKVETEYMAVRAVEGRHFGCEVVVKSVVKVS